MRILALAIPLLLACGGPSRTTYAQYPGAPLAFDRASANPEAIALADKVVAAHGGAAPWEKAKQIRWRQTVMRDGASVASGEQAWDRWNARHWAKVDRGESGGVAVMYELYGDFTSGYVEMKSGNRQGIPKADAADGIKVARAAWQRDATITFAPWLMYEPGSKLEYAGMIKDEAGTEYHDLKLTFDPKDTARSGLIVHIYPDKESFVVRRVEVENAAGERYAYQLEGYQDVSGMKLSTERKNVASGELIKLSEVRVGDPDDMLFAPPPLI